MIKIFIRFISLSFIISHFPLAAIDFSQPLSMTELLTIALENNPQTKTIWWNAQRAVAAKELAKAAYFPTLGLDGSVIHGYDYKFQEGPESSYTSVNAELVLSYLLLDFGEREATYESAKAALIEADWQSNWTIQTLFFDVLKNAYAFLNAQEVLNARLATLDDLDTTLDSVDALNRSGLRSIADVYNMRSTVAEAKMDIANQRANVDILRIQLAVSLGLNPDAYFQLSPLPDPSTIKIKEIELQNLLTIAQVKRADLMSKRADIVQKEFQWQSSIAQYQPKLNLNGDTGYKKYLHDRSSGVNYNVGIFFDMPLYTGGAATAKSQLAKANLLAAKADLESMELTIARDLTIVSRKFKASQEVLSLTANYLDNANKTYEGIFERYKAGTQSIFDLSASQRQLAEARIRFGEAKTAWYRDLAELAYATGTLQLEDSCITSQD